MVTTLIVLAIGALGAAPVMDDVAIRRYANPSHYHSPIHVDPRNYECAIGLPGRLKNYIGQEVYFYPHGGGGKRLGPWIVADIESVHDSGYMDRHDLAGDISCAKYNHMSGLVVYRGEVPSNEQISDQLHSAQFPVRQSYFSLDRIPCSYCPGQGAGSP